ncbi:MAG: hypothetical protein WCX46_01570 [Candidatus Paceibacterota bacterium]
MFKYGIPIILIGVAVGGFLMFTNPLYKDIKNLRREAVSYDEALTNSKALESQRDALTQKYNSINPENLNRLQKLLPDNVDNIRLILEIEKVASPYGMVLKDVKYDTVNSDNDENTKSKTVKNNNNDYGSWDLEFSTQGNYSNFLNFVKDLEKNLRILDIASVDFSSNVSSGVTTNKTMSPSDSYKYTFKIKTYWLKG